jgi:hypothetical protein
LIHEELSQIEYQGEQVYRMRTTLASRMIVIQLAPLLPKDSEEVNAQVKHLQAMLDAAIVENPTSSTETEGGVRTLTTTRAYTRTWPATSLHPRSAIEIRMEGTCGTSSATEMHATELKTGAKSETTLSVNDASKGTMITLTLTMTSPTGNVP